MRVCFLPYVLLATHCKQAIPPCSALRSPSRSATAVPPCCTQQELGQRLVPTAGGRPMPALVGCPAEPGQPRQGTLGTRELCGRIKQSSGQAGEQEFSRMANTEIIES